MFFKNLRQKILGLPQKFLKKYFEQKISEGKNFRARKILVRNIRNHMWAENS